MKLYSKKPSGAVMLIATCVVGSTLFAPGGVAAPDDYATYTHAYKTGRAAAVTHDWPKAREGWESAIKQAQGARQKAAAMLGLAETARQQKQLEEAKRLCQEVLAMPEKLPEMATAHLLLSNIYQQQGNTREAVQQWRELKILVPDWYGPEPGVKITKADLPQLIYGSLLGDVKGKTMDQIRVLLEALVKDPKTPAFKQADALKRLGEFALKAQQVTLARDYFTKSLDIVPAETQFKALKASTEVRLGDACAAEGDWTAARQAYERALPEIYEMERASVKAKRDAAAKAETQNA